MKKHSTVYLAFIYLVALGCHSPGKEINRAADSSPEPSPPTVIKNENFGHDSISAHNPAPAYDTLITSRYIGKFNLCDSLSKAKKIFKDHKMVEKTYTYGESEYQGFEIFFKNNETLNIENSGGNGETVNRAYTNYTGYTTKSGLRVGTKFSDLKIDKGAYAWQYVEGPPLQLYFFSDDVTVPIQEQDLLYDYTKTSNYLDDESAEIDFQKFIAKYLKKNSKISSFIVLPDCAP